MVVSSEIFNFSSSGDFANFTTSSAIAVSGRRPFNSVPVTLVSMPAMVPPRLVAHAGAKISVPKVLVTRHPLPPR